jgi:2-polyprenyl-3-methyl-5-hydroxy-6-metoxy-1,4-benzoquinol methylase
MGEHDSQGPSAYSDHRFNPSGTNDSWSNLFALIPPGSRVLDVGCSSGNFGEALERLSGCTVVGIDLNEADVAEAATKISSALVFDVTTAVSLEPLGSFDVVVFADVLEHLVDPRGVLTRIRSILNEGGFAVYSIPNMTHTSVRLDLLGGVFGYTETGILDRTHLHFYDRIEVDDVFVGGGFEITDESPVIFEYPAEMLENSLGALGLEFADADRFVSMLTKTDGTVLQFVGKAVPAAEPRSTELSLGREREFPPTEITRWVQEQQGLRDLAIAEREDALAERDVIIAERDEASAGREAERARADLAEARLRDLETRVAEFRKNPVGFALRRLRPR